MQIDSSASRTGSEPASAWEWATTVRMPISRQVRRTRKAISPRLAMRILWNMSLRPPLAARLHEEEVLAELHGLGVLHEDLHHAAGHLGLDLVHELHRLDDAEGLAFLHDVAFAHEGRSVWAGRSVEGADHGRIDAHRPRGQLRGLTCRLDLGQGHRRCDVRGGGCGGRAAAHDAYAKAHALYLELREVVGHRQLDDLLGRPGHARGGRARPRLPRHGR